MLGGSTSELLEEASYALAEEGPDGAGHLVEASILLFICVSTVFTNVLILWAVSTSPSPKEAIDFYVLSIAVADLLAGLIIVPLSAYTAYAQEWVFGDLLCRLTGFLGLTLWTVCLYTFMWISVDRYLAIRKPLRYDVIQTRTRCQCWVVFTWLTSIFLCSPPLLGFSKGRFYSDGYICMLDLGHMVPYSITLATLVLVPSVATIGYTYFYILGTMYRLRKCLSDKDYATAVSENLANPDHLMSFVLVLFFAVTWFPWFGFLVFELVTQADPAEYHAVHFSMLWLGMSDCLWKFFIYLALSPKFRLELKRACFCRQPTRQPLIV